MIQLMQDTKPLFNVTVFLFLKMAFAILYLLRGHAHDIKLVVVVVLVVANNTCDLGLILS